ncbi:LemA protein [Mycoplasma testudineum]|uniref:LemA protein n=1 Tax=Mycoplasma testudineum TaxID=244584 RepID=A0A4R6IBW9_9MOLU|nr:LemA family protein [Mycoplasma testudineum]OYD26554.1 hypothetical protein CG473_03545 [Mycoplasma testudineum]TDO19106.1 LemA protein [Mycoplasma testudineum]
MSLVDPRQATDEPQGFNPNVNNANNKAKLSTAGKILWIISWFLTIFITLIVHVVLSNKFNRQQMDINNAASSIDVYLKNRKDTLTKLVDGTRSYVKYEKEVLNQVTELRNMNIGQSNRVEAQGKIESAFGRLLAVAENYPDLKASQLYKDTMSQASYIEQEIAAARRNYNANVNQFNQDLFTWPASIVAGWKRLVQLPLFVASAEDKKDVSLDI